MSLDYNFIGCDTGFFVTCFIEILKSFLLNIGCVVLLFFFVFSIMFFFLQNCCVGSLSSHFVSLLRLTLLGIITSITRFFLKIETKKWRLILSSVASILLIVFQSYDFLLRRTKICFALPYCSQLVQHFA